MCQIGKTPATERVLPPSDYVRKFSPIKAKVTHDIIILWLVISTLCIVSLFWSFKSFHIKIFYHPLSSRVFQLAHFNMAKKCLCLNYSELFSVSISQMLWPAHRSTERTAAASFSGDEKVEPVYLCVLVTVWKILQFFIILNFTIISYKTNRYGAVYRAYLYFHRR